MIWKGRDILAGVDFPMSPVASSICERKELRSSRTLPRAGWLNIRAIRASVGGDQEPDGHCVRAPEFLCGRISAFTHQSGLEGGVAEGSQSLGESPRLPGVHLKDYGTMRNQIL